MKYTVVIEEILRREVAVEAENSEEAKEIAEARQSKSPKPSTRNYNRQAPGANTSGASFTNSQIHTKMNLRSEIVKKFGVDLLKSSE